MSSPGGKWRLQNATCVQQKKLKHVLSSCPKAPSQGRYTWCHNQVLKPIVEAIRKGISSYSRVYNITSAIAFVKAGAQQKAGHKKALARTLAMAQDWQLSLDLERQLKVSQHIASTTLRPDILLVSEHCYH